MAPQHPSRVSVEELSYLHEKLSVEERDELLQCLLIAAPRGGEAMIEVLEDLLLCHAAEELCEERRHLGQGSAGGSDRYGLEGD